MTLNVFDLDKTLINGDSNELWHEFLCEKKIIDENFIKEDKRLMDLYAQGKLNMDEYLNFACDAFSKISIQETNLLLKIFIQEKIQNIVFSKAKEWINNAKHKLIISATPEFIVKEVANFLNIKDAIGMRLKQKNGFFTKEYEIPLSYQEGKVHCLQNWLKEKNLHFDEIIFYTDSINDLPLCNFATKINCINPDQKLKHLAIKNNWIIHELK